MSGYTTIAHQEGANGSWVLSRPQFLRDYVISSVAALLVTAWLRRHLLRRLDPRTQQRDPLTAPELAMLSNDRRGGAGRTRVSTRSRVDRIGTGRPGTDGRGYVRRCLQPRRPRPVRSRTHRRRILDEGTGNCRCGSFDTT